MDAPKISVLIPMYNRKHYIQDCVNSVLNQTFQDFEIIIRDNCSTDGSFEFVKKCYANEIASGKIKLKRSFKNLGEFGNENHLLLDATGKYVQFLHSDDLLLPEALQHLYQIAEKTSADVVHAQSFLVVLDSEFKNGSPKANINTMDAHPVNQVTIMPNDTTSRFSEWIDRGTFWDVQYNLFNRNFLMDNEIFIEVPGGSSLTMALWWLMLAKVFVKTPIPFYVRRDAPDSLTNTDPKLPSTDRIPKIIMGAIELFRQLDKLFDKVELFKNNMEIQYMIKAHCVSIYDNWHISRHGFYKNGVTPEINKAVEDAFKKYFGDDYAYPALLYHWAHVIPYNRPVDKIFIPSAPPVSRNS